MNLASLVAVLPTLSALEDRPDPLPQAMLELGFKGGYSAAIPGMVALVAVWPLLFVLRRAQRRWQPLLSFLAGVFVGLIPLLFYWMLQSYWSYPAPLATFAVRGLIGGCVLGAMAVWYVPRSV